MPLSLDLLAAFAGPSLTVFAAANKLRFLWLEEYVKKKGLTCKMRKKDLDGFGANFEQDVTF